MLKKMMSVVAVAGVVLALTGAAQAAVTTLPSGLNAGDEYRLVFVTSAETYSGGSNHGSNPPWFTTAADYNAWGTTQATAVPELNTLGTTWTAIVSTRDEGTNATVDARDNTNTNPTVETGVPIYNLAGLLVANNNAHLWDTDVTPLANPINVTELGTGPTLQHNDKYRVWTGTNVNGTNAGGQRLIWQDGGWISNGLADATGGTDGWIRGNFTNDIHTHDQPIYVMSGVLTAVPEPATMTLLALGGLALVRRRRK